MPYELHIEGLEEKGEVGPIPLDAWKAAVSALEGIRFCVPGVQTITNPRTGEVISIPRRDGDAEVYFPDEQTWHAVFRWFDGGVSFNASFEPGNSSHPVWSKAVVLASRLGAVIRGDDGEIYDLSTGEITD